jgi:hypothetical protein
VETPFGSTESQFTLGGLKICTVGMKDTCDPSLEETEIVFEDKAGCAGRTERLTWVSLIRTEVPTVRVMLARAVFVGSARLVATTATVV